MPVNSAFDPEKVHLVDIELVKKNISSPFNYNVKENAEYPIKTNYDVGFNFEKKLVKAEIGIQIESITSENNPKETYAEFTFVFLYQVENLDELAEITKGQIEVVNDELETSIASITYSTTRGLIMNHLQSTAFQNMILPVIDPGNLREKNE